MHPADNQSSDIAHEQRTRPTEVLTCPSHRDDVVKIAATPMQFLMQSVTPLPHVARQAIVAFDGERENTVVRLVDSGHVGGPAIALISTVSSSVDASGEQV